MNIFFDLDGTLLDSMPMWNNLERDFVESYGKEIDNESLWLLNSLTEKEMIKYLRDVLEIDFNYEEIENFFERKLFCGYSRDLKLRKDVLETLDYLKSKGHNLSLATMTDYKYCKLAIERFSLNDYLDFILAPDLIDHSKSSPKFFEYGLKKYNNNEKSYLVDDASYALKVARKANIIPIAIEDKNGRKILIWLRAYLILP